MNHLPYCCIVVFFFLTGCRPNPVEKLSGKWKPVNVTGEGMNAERKKEFLKEGNMMEFTKDGKFINFSTGIKNDTGNYAFSEDGRTLMVRAFDGKQTQFSINELKRNRIILETGRRILVLEPVK